MAIEVMQGHGLDVDARTVAAASSRTRWPGRLEWFGKTGAGLDTALVPGRVLLDGAHNRAGMLALRDYLDDCGIRDVHLVVGFKYDKAAEDILPVLFPYTRKIYAVAPPVEQSYPPGELVRAAAAAGVPAEQFADLNAALSQALDQLCLQ